MLTNQQIATTGLLDLLYYDDTIMDNFTVPDGIDRQLALDTIYQRCGLTPLYHPDPAWLKFYIGRWCSKNVKTWEELYKTTIQDYNPIYNYDRTEETTDTRSGTRKLSEDTSSNTKQNGDTSVTDTSSDNSEHTISADNSDTYEPGYKDASSRQDTQSSESSNRVDVTGDRAVDETTGETYSHKLRAYGNIGVTTTQEMLEAQRTLVRYNVYNEIADSFKEEFCLYIY